MNTYDTLSSTLNRLISRGYTFDFNLKRNHLILKSTNQKLKAEEFNVDEVYRFEGMSNPDDNAILFAITSSDGLKGTLLDAYGMYTDFLSKEIIEKLKIKY